VLTIEEVDDPTPGRDDIVVDVEHTAVNRADILQRMGMYPDPRRRSLEIPASNTQASSRRSAPT
jgi:NADPH:quinone reductase-like Zn-dependent oxidoreductase